MTAAVSVEDVSKRFRRYRERPTSIKERIIRIRVHAEELLALQDISVDVEEGFHIELTGRENVYLNASLLGLSRQETDRVFDDIVAFAELEDFVDNQVKFYSSGMYVRLGFAVAVHVDPAILLVDEVLAVGDIAFQRKCLDKVEQFQQEGRTIVFVTHAPDQVVRVCDRAIVLNKGRIVNEGNPHDVVRDFRRLMSRQDLAY